MKKIQISTDRMLLIMIMLLLWYSTLLQACESESESDIHLQPKITVVKDEIHPVNIIRTGLKRRRGYKK